jgi:hypothetical protein
MSRDRDVRDPQLARASGRLGTSGRWFLALGVIVGVPGVVLIIVGHAWVFAVGLALLAIAIAPIVVAAGLLLSSAVARWAARHRPFA